MADEYVPQRGSTCLCWAGKRGDGSVFERVHVSALEGRDRVTVEEQADRVAGKGNPEPVKEKPKKARRRREHPGAPPPAVIGKE